ncbi:MAG TPA: AMP-binding protein [Steroidobacteraceae bacterium]
MANGNALLKIDDRLRRLAIGERFVRRNPLYYGKLRQQLLALRNASLEERIAFTKARLERVLHVASRTPYGRHLGAPPTLEKWPMMRKELVRDDPGAFHTTNTWFAARANTGGTTGTPLQLIRSPQSVVVEQVCIDQVIMELGSDPFTARIAVLRGDNVKDVSDTSPPYWTYAIGGRRLIFSTNHLSASTVRMYIDELARFRPDLLWVYPTSLESLCQLVAQEKLELHVPRVMSASEKLHPQVWTFAQEVLGCKLIDYYGQAERVAFAYAKTPGAYYFVPGYAFVEFIPHSVDGDLCTYEIVGTSLWNDAMPLVRYRTGDLMLTPRAWGAKELEEVAFGLRPFVGIVGRDGDVLLSPKGSKLVGIDHIPRGVPHILRIQVVQEDVHHIRVLVLPAPGFSARDREQLMHNARLKVPREMSIEIECVESLERTASGKTPLVIHRPRVKELLHAARSAGVTA